MLTSEQKHIYGEVEVFFNGFLVRHITDLIVDNRCIRVLRSGGSKAGLDSVKKKKVFSLIWESNPDSSGIENGDARGE
jgi:hypothetical protein